jgi:hypothetical protein
MLADFEEGTEEGKKKVILWVSTGEVKPSELREIFETFC